MKNPVSHGMEATEEFDPGDAVAQIPSLGAPEVNIFERIVQTVRGPLIVLDSSLCVIMANDSFYRAFGVPAEDTEDRRLDEICDGALNIPQLTNLAGEIQAAGSQVIDFELEHSFPVLGKRTMHISATLMVSGSGNPNLILLALEDITDRWLRDQRLAVLNAQLRRSNLDLEEFARSASHDLQEPLRKIRAFADRLEQETGGSLSPAGSFYLDRILRAAGRMQKLTDSLLTLARTGAVLPLLVKVDLAVVVAEVLEDLEETIKNSKAEIHISELPVVQADPVQMGLLFQNLISNAIKFKKKEESPVIRISSRPLSALDKPGIGFEGGWEIAVEDNGIGFEERHRERIFGVFQRLHSKDRYEGSGIGLSICRHIIEHHGGMIEVHSLPGVGSSFLIQLPRSPAYTEDSSVSTLEVTH